MGYNAKSNSDSDSKDSDDNSLAVKGEFSRNRIAVLTFDPDVKALQDNALHSDKNTGRASFK